MKVVILAVSKKNGGWCVVGKNAENLSQWIRLVGDKNGRELYDREITINDGNRLRLLNTQDVVEVELGNSCSLLEQPENTLYKKLDFIERLDRIGEMYLDYEKMIFGNVGEYIDADGKAKSRSVLLIKVSNLKIEYNEPIVEGGKPKTYAWFTFNGFEYRRLRVTDPNCRKTESIGNAVLCVSLGQAYNIRENGRNTWPVDRHYKFVAAVYRLI